MKVSTVRSPDCWSLIIREGILAMNSRSRWTTERRQSAFDRMLANRYDSLRVCCPLHYTKRFIGDSVASLENGKSPLTIFLLIRYGKVGCIHKYPMMVWTYQLLCCESSILRSV
jgi:hypothetical protein